MSCHTEAERRVLHAAVDLAQAYNALQREEGVSHPSHGQDVADAVHVVQRVIAVRLAKRVDPEAWGDVEPPLPRALPVATVAR